MAANTLQISLLAITISFLFFEQGSTLRMEASPKPFNKVLHKKLDISCILDGPSASSQDVVVMQIGRPGHNPIANMDAKHGLTLGRTTSQRIQAEGHIDNSGGRSELTILVSNPVAGDAGPYTCSVFYLDKAYQLKEIQAETNITMDNDDLASIVTYFEEKVTRLDESVKGLKKTVAAQKRLIGQLKDDNKKQEQQLELLEQSNEKQEHLKESNNKQEQQLKLLKESNDKQEKQLKLLNAYMNGTTDIHKCAFSVGDKIGRRSYTSGTMTFTQTFTNLGNHYDTTTGVFTAPIDGVYVFNLVVATWGAKDSLIAYLRVTGNGRDIQDMVFLSASSFYHMDQSSSSVILSLQAGDQVFPHAALNGGSKDSWDGHFSMFSGFLLYT